MDKEMINSQGKDNAIIARFRYDYFLIWGHGLQFRDDIFRLIEQEPFFEIKKIMYHEPSSIKKFVNTVYSYDYAPIFHLKSKTQYLLKTPKRVLLIFIRNNKPDEEWFGTGRFRHYECLQVKKLKENIRDMFNPREHGKRTEHHVIHASDNQGQAEAMLVHLGYPKGFDEVEMRKGVVDAPYHLGRIRSVELKNVDIRKVYAWIVTPQGMKAKSIFETPHFKTLNKGSDAYKEYLDAYLGYQLKDYYSVEKFQRLRNSFRDFNDHGRYILVEPYEEDSYLILDGLHRAAIIADRGDAEVLVAKVES